MANNATLEQALARFGTVTVLEPTFYPLGSEDEIFTLDTLRISNFTQEGPTKTAKGGLNAEIVMRYGKTARLEMEDVVGRASVLRGLMGARNGDVGPATEHVEKFFGDGETKTFVLKYPVNAVTITVNGVNQTTPGEEEDVNLFNHEGNIVILDTAPAANVPVIITYNYAAPESIHITEKFNGMYEIKGRTFVINQYTGEREYIKITVHKFLPDSLLNLTMEAEGDFGVINIGGELFTNDCGVFYTIEKDDSNPC